VYLPLLFGYSFLNHAVKFTTSESVGDSGERPEGRIVGRCGGCYQSKIKITRGKSRRTNKKHHGDLVGSDTFFHSQDYPSCLMLPVVD
jgi:hypothetical protein